MSQLEIVPMIQREMRKRHLTAAGLARSLRVNPASINGMMSRPTMQVHKLAELSDVLQYNFFREIATLFPYTEPDYTIPPDRSEVEALQKRVKELELEVSILRQVCKI